MDLLAMLCKDLGITVGDNYSNIGHLEEKKMISTSLGGQLKKLNGLRNILVHRYNKADEREILLGLDTIKEAHFAFLEVVENSSIDLTKISEDLS